MKCNQAQSYTGYRHLMTLLISCMTCSLVKRGFNSPFKPPLFSRRIFCIAILDLFFCIPTLSYLPFSFHPLLLLLVYHHTLISHPATLTYHPTLTSCAPPLPPSSLPFSILLPHFCLLLKSSFSSSCFSTILFQLLLIFLVICLFPSLLLLHLPTSSCHFPPLSSSYNLHVLLLLYVF